MAQFRSLYRLAHRFHRLSTAMALTLGTTVAVGQPSARIDSLRRAVAMAGSDTAAVHARLALCMELRHAGDTTFLGLLDTTRLLAARAGMDVAEVMALLEKGRFFIARGHPDTALVHLEEAHALAAHRGLAVEQGYALYHLAEVHRTRSAHTTALELYGRALAIYDRLQMDRPRAAVLFAQGAVLDHLGRSEESLHSFREALTIHERLGDTFGMGVTLNSLGVMHEHLGRHAEALRLFRDALALLQPLDHGRGEVANVLSSIASAHRFLGNSDSARHYMEASMAIRAAMNDQVGMGLVLVRYSRDLQDMGDMDGAAHAVERALGIFRSIGARQHECQALMRHAELLHARGRSKEALPVAAVALAIADSTRSMNEAVEAHHLLHLLHEATGDLAGALHHHRAMTAMKDSLRTQESVALLHELHTRYETGVKDRHLAEQQVQLAEQQAALARRGKVLWGAGIGGAALAVIAALTWRDRRRQVRLMRERMARLESEKQAAAARALLQGEERERQRVAAELHDGIGLLLSAARMRVDTAAPGGIEKASIILAEAATEVRRISHALMPGTLARLGLPDALSDLARALAPGGLHVDVHVHGINARLPAPIETGLYRMVQEILNNTVKHAQATRATIDLSREDDDRLSMVVSDNGRGFAPLAAGSGHGLDHIRSRAALLGGNAHLHTAPGRGTQWEIDIPLHHGNTTPDPLGR